MDRNQGKPSLRRHLALVEGLDRAPLRTLRDLRKNDWEHRELDRLARLAGGLEALEALDAEPLPLTEPFDFAQIETADAPVVQGVLTALHEHRPPHFDAVSKLGLAYTPAWLHGEYVTIVHRLIARAVPAGVADWRRRPRRVAAAFVWLALGGNWAMGRSHPIRARDIWRWYEVSDSPAFARRLCVDARLGSLYVPEDESRPLRDLHIVFGDALVLHSSFRAFLVNKREELARWIVEEDQRRSSQRPVRFIGDGRFELRARQGRPLWALKAPSVTGRASVMVALGRSTDDDDYELVGLSVPDARLLVGLVQDALDSPSTSATMSGVQTDRTPP